MVGWLSRRVTKRFTRNKGNKKDSQTVDAPSPPVVEGQLDPSKFIVSKNVMSVVTHSAVPVLCTVIFNVIRTVNPDLLWPADTDPNVVDQIVSVVNELLIGISALAAAWGSVHDINKFRVAQKTPSQIPPTT